MHKIQDNAELTSDISSSSKDRTAGGSDAWGDSNGKNESIKRIRAANRKVRLYSILKSYNVQTPKAYSGQVWSNLIPCPFPDHKDRTPSFGYNFVQDRFNCFGCKKSGRAVEFIAGKEGKKKILVAESILEHYADAEYLEDLPEEEEEDPRVQELLFQMSETIREAIQKSKGEATALKNIDKIIWWFDMYIAVRAGQKNNCRSSNIGVEELEARVFKAKSLLEQLT